MNEDTQLNLGGRLRAAREQAGLSQGQVARMMECHRPTISEIEAGRRKVTSDEIKWFSTTYGVSVAWLLDSEEKSDPLVELAARQLSKLKKEDLDKFLRLLRSLTKEKGK